ncbi:MAG: glycosyltransferase family 9 protein [Magnetococcales bacterium]|nr:glycosyltransferase family 9 protein [Magnetococcales bacterium]
MKILVFRFGSLGDTIMALPALQWIRDHYGPESDITLLENRSAGAEVSARHLLEGTSYVNHFLAYPTGKRDWNFFREMLHLIRGIRQQNFHAVINLAPGQRTHRLAFWRDQLFFSLCLIRNRIGFRPFTRQFLYPRDPDGRLAMVPAEAAFLLERLTASGLATGRSLADPLPPVDLELTEEELRQAKTWLASKRRHPDRPLVVMAPGVKQPVNQWPLDRYAALGSALLRGELCELVVIGGKKDLPLQEKLLETWQEGIGASGLFSPRLTAAILSRSQLFIGSDSGPVHLASAAGVPCIAIYSDRDSPGRWHPLGRQHQVLRKSVPCGGCGFSVCPRPDHLCVMSVGTSEVLDAAGTHLQPMRKRGGREEATRQEATLKVKSMSE